MSRLLFFLAALFFLLIVFFPYIRLGVLAALFLRDSLYPEGAPGLLARVTKAPSVTALRLPGNAQSIAADLYRVPDRKKRAAILVTHGIIEDGKDDSRLVRLAGSLARVGFVVLVPELKGMKSLKILPSDADDIVSSFRYLASVEGVDEKKMGLLGFSYGAGPTFIAAAHPAIRDRVKFLASFGGYFDPVNVIRYITTGYYEYGSEKGYLKPEAYGKWVFFLNNLDYVKDERARETLRRIFAKESEGKREEARSLSRNLNPEARHLYELLTNEDPARVDDLVKRIDPNVREQIERISLAPVIPSLRAYLLIGHGTTDPLIPYTESLRLADAVPDKRRVHLAILRQFAHVDPAHPASSIKELLTSYLPSLARFYALCYDLIRQQL